MNHKLGRIPFISLICYSVIVLLVTWQEYYTIDLADFKVLLSVRILVAASVIPLALVLRKNPFSAWANSLAALNFLVHTCVGHYYRPLYFASYIQILYAFAFLFFTSRRLYFILSSVISFGYIAFYLYTYDMVTYAQGAETKEDFIATVICAHFVGFLIHYFFTSERGLREAATDRFVLLGRHATNIIHDIKGSISVPHMYLNEVRNSLKSGDLSKADEYLNKMEKSFSRTEKTIFDLNQLSRIAADDGESFKLKDAIGDVLDMLAKRLHDVEVTIEGDFEVKSDRGVVCSILLNLVLNSLENFKKSRTENPKIEFKIHSASRLISVIDNGGGFSKEALAALKGYYPTSAATSNSGLGLYLVRENLKTLKGKVSFQNIDQGAKVEIKL